MAHRARKRRLRHGNQAVGQEVIEDKLDAILPSSGSRTPPNSTQSGFRQHGAAHRRGPRLRRRAGSAHDGRALNSSTSSCASIWRTSWSSCGRPSDRRSFSSPSRRGGLRGGAHPRLTNKPTNIKRDRRGSPPPEGHRIRRLHPHPQTGHRVDPLVVRLGGVFPMHPL